MCVKTKDSNSIIETISFFIVVLYCFCTVNNILFSQWQPEVRLTNDPANSLVHYGCSWAVAANGNIVHVVWWDNRNGNNEIYYKRSTDGGVSWGADTRLTNSAGTSSYPSVALSGTYVHVVWNDNRDGNDEIYYKRSTDKGLSWTADTRLTNDNNTSALHSLSVTGNFVHISWVDNRNGPFGRYEIYYKRSTDNGSGWGADTRMTNDSAESLNTSVSASGSNVHIVWNDLRDGYNDGNMEIYYKRSTNSGLSWGADTRLTYNTALSEYSSVSATGLNVNIVWRDMRDGQNEIYYKRSADGGINWGSDMRLTNDPANKDYPNVASCGSNVHVAWADMRDNIYQVYYKRSTDAGTSWGADTRLTFNSVLSANPTIAVSGTSVHTVWHDNRFGNYEVFYKRNPTGNLFPTYTISGRVTFADNGQPVNFGMVKALHYDRVTSNFISVDSTTIQPEGYYTLTRVPQDTIYIMYYPNDEAIPQFVPTYYRSAIDWQQADKIYPTENLTDIDGQVYRINNNGSSNLFIGGTSYTYNDLPIAPLGDVIIYAKIGNDFKNYGISNGNGAYTAAKLPPGDYTLFAYRIGYDYLTRNVTLSGNSLDTINFYFGPPIGIKQINETVPLQINLYQNYPNPFNPATKITFDIPALPGLLGNGKNNIFTELIIYDVLGKEIAVLVHGQLQPGKYEVIWNTGDHPSGLYFCRLRTGDFLQTKKMLLIK